MSFAQSHRTLWIHNVNKAQKLDILIILFLSVLGLSSHAIHAHAQVQGLPNYRILLFPEKRFSRVAPCIVPPLIVVNRVLIEDSLVDSKSVSKLKIFPAVV